jgi:hypothetical protein
MSRATLVTILLFASTACGPATPIDTGLSGSGDGGQTDGGASDGGRADSGPAGMTCDPSTVTCVDQSIATLDLFTSVAPGAITEEGTTTGEFTTHIDATGGGQTPSKSFVYAKFDSDGLKKVAIDDESAFTSQDWDIAFRRYIIRVNSGVSGPSCVQAGRTAPGSTFDSVATTPANLSFRTEAYFSDTCDFVADGSGLNGPGTAMSSYWTYGACLKMTGNIYVIQLADGRHVKVQVLSYYEPAAQQMCETSNSLPSPSGSANIRLRWAFLP